MWLLKLHFSISILCYLTFVGFKQFYKEELVEKIHMANGNKKKHWSLLIPYFFIPVLNVVLVICLLLIIGMKKEELEAMIKKNKEN